MGIGRFAFTPLLPLMVRDGSLAQSAGAWLAASNYLGYLAGALTASRLGLSLPMLMRASLAGIAMATAAMGAFHGLAAWIILRFVAGVLSAYTLIATSAWALQHLTRAASTNFSGIVYAGVGLGIALTGLFCVVAAQPGVPAGQLWLELGVLAAFAVACCSPFVGRPLETSALARSTSHPDVTLGPYTGVVVCYGVLGFGYILPATFLPALAREVVDDPQLFGLAWPVFGVAAALSTITTARPSVMPTGCASGPSAISSWPLGHPAQRVARPGDDRDCSAAGRQHLHGRNDDRNAGGPGAGAGQPHGASRSDDRGFRHRSTGRPCRLRYARPFAIGRRHRPRLRPAARGLRARAQRGLYLASFAL